MTSTVKSCFLAGLDDVSAVVDVHIAAFPGFFLTTLGPTFLKVMYRAFLSSEAGIFIVAKDNHGARGFAVGVLKSAGKDRVLALRFLPHFLIAVIPGFLRSPMKVARRLLSQFLGAGGQPEIPDGASVLRSIGIRPEEVGSGLASELLKEYENASIVKGARSVALTTDVIENERAIRFYRKNGYEIKQQFRQGNARLMYLMIKRF